jgi:2-hydroxychromene-2-carboxylate isomerase
MLEHTPEGFPPMTLTAMRALCAVTLGPAGQERLVACLETLLRAYWVEGKRTDERSVLAEELGRVLGAEETAKGAW